MDIQQGRRPPIFWVALFTVVIIATIFYSFHTGRSMAERYAPLMAAAEGIKYEGTAAHLWFEEIISGDPYLDIRKIWKHLDNAEQYGQAMLEGGRFQGITMVALEDSILRDGIKQTLAGIQAFRHVAEERWQQRQGAEVGSDIDQRFDKIYDDFLASADDVEATLQRAMEEQLQRFRLTQILLVATISILGMFVGVVLQRHERRRNTDIQALEIKEEEQRDILDFMLNAVISINEKGDVLSFNKAAEQLFGYIADEIKGKNIKLLMPEKVSSQHDDYLRKYMKTGKDNIFGFDREVEGRRKNKDIFPMRLLVTKLPNDKTGMQRFIGSCQDLTEIKLQEEQLRRSQKMDAMGKLTGGIAHDYNNLLGIIMGYSEQINDQLNSDSVLAKYNQSIYRAAERGAKLTQKLLSFTRHKSSDANVLNINLLLHEQLMMLEKMLTARISLELDLAENLWLVWLDGSDLEDAIVNMCINAMHAISGNGQLTLSTSNKQLSVMEAQHLHLEAGDYVVLSISDTGAGMDEVTRERIFDPFFSTKGEHGTGLGLSQVYGFVKRSGGAINVSSEEGRGSCFVLYFPRSHEAMSDEPADSHSEKKDLRGSETLLVVDDEPALLNLAQEILRKQGYRVLSACDGKQALLVLELENVDLVISDVVMPYMDGFQLAAQVQQIYPGIKLQLVSGFANEQRHLAVDTAWRGNLLHKPYTSNDLLTRVRHLLDEGNIESRSTVS